MPGMWLAIKCLNATSIRGTNDDMLSMELQDLIDKEKYAQDVKLVASMIKL